MQFKNVRYLSVHCLVCCLFVGLLTEQANGQRGKRRSASGGFDVSTILTQIDTNGNGMLEPNEMAGRTKEFVRKAGLDPNRPHAISTITNKLNNANINKDAKNNGNAKTDSGSQRKVPGFGIDRDAPDIMDFSPTGEERMSVAAMNNRFGPGVMSQVERSMTRYDKDKNGLIDPTEQKRTRWTNPTADVTDSNKDGNLSRLELAYRYKKREDDALNRGKTATSARRNNSTTNKRAANNVTASNRNVSSRTNRSARSSNYRTSASQNNVASKAKTGFSRGNDAYKRYAEGLIKNYDKNGDKKLSEEEMKEMRRPLKGADTNKDGFVDQNELVASVTAKSGAGTTGIASSRDVQRSSSKEVASKRRSSRKTYNSADNVFGGKDTNSDGQLQMSEYAADWDQETVDEFKSKDLNGDGVITAKEWQGI